MRWSKVGMILVGGLAAAWLLGWQWAPSQAQQANPTANRFEFPVIESFDAKYLGDTPGHSGHGKFGSGRPDVALNDPVFRGDRKIGKVTGLIWDRSKDSLTVEFDPEPYELDRQKRPVAENRVVVGETVWIPLGGSGNKAEGAR
jgi:hypothetical protein